MKVKTIYSQPRIQLIKVDAATALAASGVHGYGPGDPIWDDDEETSEENQAKTNRANGERPDLDAKPSSPWTTWD